MMLKASLSGAFLRSTITATALATIAMSPAGAGAQHSILWWSVQYRRGEPDVPNVPDRNGCVRLCEFDLNPCDTPLEKKLDGRCTRKD